MTESSLMASTVSVTADPVFTVRMATAVRRRWPTGFALAATSICLSLIAPLPHSWQTGITGFSVLLAAVIYLTWGSVRSELTRGRLAAQTAGVLAFGALAIAGVGVAPHLGRYLLAAGWLAHAAWDVVHHRMNRVVPRWYAETCMVSDFMIAGMLIFVGAV